MKNFEKKLKDKFIDEVSPEGIDSNELWSSIQSELKTEDDPRGLFGKNISKYFKYLFLLALIAAGVFFIINSVPTKELNDAQTGISKTSAELPAKNPINSSTVINSAPKTSPSKSIANNSSQDIDEKIVPSKTPNNEIEKSGEKTNNIIANSNQNDGIEYLDQTAIVGNSNVVPIIHKHQDNKDALTENFSNPKINSVKEKAITRTEIATFALLLNKGLFPITKKDKSLQKFQPSEMSLDLSQAKFSVGIHGGIHFMRKRFAEISNSGTTITVLNKAFKVQPSSHFGIDLIFNLNKNWFGSIGGEYQNTIVQFNYSESWDSTVIRNDIFNGQKVNAKATRTIVHLNKQTVFSIPINIGYQHISGRWKFGASAGITANFIQNQTGKSLNSRNEIAIYPNNENQQLPLNKFYLSYQFNPIMNYSILNTLDLQFKSSFRYHQFGTSDFYQANQNALSFGIGLGLIYTPK